MAELREGTQVTSTIRLLRRLGEGGMGSVWVARHEALSADVVVKFLADRLVEDPTSRARFSHEASAAARVRSPHVVQMLDHGVTDDGHPFLVMELLDGHDLGHELKRRKRLPPVEVAHVVEHVALALSKAHAKNIIHRDIKPSNVFLCDVGAAHPFVKLVDFGIAAGDWDKLTTTGQAVGTPAYMSPEQLSGASVDFRTDLWSLGVVAFRALCGGVPFDRPSVAELMGSILHAPMPLPSAHQPELPPAVDAWFLRACAREPRARFASATEMAEALWEAVGAPKPLASSPSHSQPLPLDASELPPTEVLTDGTLRSQVQDSGDLRGHRRRGALLGVAAGALLFAAGAVVVYFAVAPAPTSARVPRVAASLRPALASAAAHALASKAVAPPEAPPADSAGVEPAKKPPRVRPPVGVGAPGPKPPIDDVSDLGF